MAIFNFLIFIKLADCKNFLTAKNSRIIVYIYNAYAPYVCMVAVLVIIYIYCSNVLFALYARHQNKVCLTFLVHPLHCLGDGKGSVGRPAILHVFIKCIIRLLGNQCATSFYPSKPNCCHREIWRAPLHCWPN